MHTEIVGGISAITENELAFHVFDDFGLHPLGFEKGLLHHLLICRLKKLPTKTLLYLLLPILLFRAVQLTQARIGIYMSASP